MSDPRDLHVIAAIDAEEALRHLGELAQQDHARLTAKIAKMQAALLAAADQFDRYVSYHLAKQPADREKAGTNLEWAARCRDAVVLDP